MSDDSFDKVLSNTAQFLRLLREAGLTDQARQRVIDDPTFRAELVHFWNGNHAYNDTVTPEQAATIMGNNFHGIDALEHHLGVKLSAKSKRLFGSVPFSAEIMQACAQTHVLVACGQLSLMDVWLVQTDLFYDIDPWFKAMRFANAKERAGWQLVRKQPVSNSTCKSFNEQKALLGANEMIPSLSVLSQAIILTYLETKECLFPGIFVRASSGDRAILGQFNGRSFHIDYFAWVSDEPNGGIGLASSIKPSS